MSLQRYFWAINLALITLFVWASVDLFVTFVSAKLDQRPLPRLAAAIAKPQETERRPKSYYSMMTMTNIFDPFGEGKLKTPAELGRVDKNAPPPPPPVPPLSTLLRLKGTIAGGADFGLAIVDDLAEHKQELIKIGSRIKDALLVAVTRDKAVFDVNGKQETLLLLEEEGPAAAASDRPASVLRGMERRAPTSRSGRSASSVTNYSPAAARGGDGLVKALSPSRYAVDRGKLTELASEPDKLADEAKVAIQDNGLLVDNIPSGGLAERAGLRSGDVVTKINGEPVSSPLQALQAYQKAMAGPSVKVEVMRNQRPLTLTYELR